MYPQCSLVSMLISRPETMCLNQVYLHCYFTAEAEIGFTQAMYAVVEGQNLSVCLQLSGSLSETVDVTVTATPGTAQGTVQLHRLHGGCKGQYYAHIDTDDTYHLCGYLTGKLHVTPLIFAAMGVDYTFPDMVVPFDGTQSPICVTLITTDDSIYEFDETLVLDLQISPSDASIVSLIPSMASVTITDDDVGM